MQVRHVARAAHVALGPLPQGRPEATRLVLEVELEDGHRRVAPFVVSDPLLLVEITSKGLKYVEITSKMSFRSKGYGLKEAWKRRSI